MTLDTGLYGTIIVDNRLYVTESASIKRIKELLEELDSLTEDYGVVYEVAAFVKFNHLEGSIARHLQQMPTGCEFEYDEHIITKVSKNLCIGKYQHVLWQYNVPQTKTKRNVNSILEQEIEAGVEEIRIAETNDVEELELVC